MSDKSKVQITLMGTGPACGSPAFYCGCKACEESKADPRARRTCSSILVANNELTLIDCAPEAHHQFAREGVAEIDRILFTHEHFDHVGGIPQLEYMVRLRTRKQINFYCSQETANYIASHFEDMADCFVLNVIEPWQKLEFDGVGYIPLPAAHCAGCFGYLIEIPAALNDLGHDAKVAYFPDTSRPSDEVLEQLKGIDLLIIDATFNGNNWMPTSHMSIDSSVALAEELGVKQVCLTHMSMHYDTPITLAEAEARFEGTNVIVSYDGLKVFGA